MQLLIRRFLINAGKISHLWNKIFIVIRLHFSVHPRICKKKINVLPIGLIEEKYNES